ncbi:TB2/DP1, HVA22 family-domain-containing protein [Phyllosticta citrichinensis]|uniref:Protein YOP1 n=1 Tax=Phyllosticta citrichinensis TaxID=1130410 RepID=A0ABR1XWT2_9PEZI
MFLGIFDVFPNLLTTGVSTLFPIFASYKALRTRDPAQLTPWLMYWVVFTIAQTTEAYAGWAVDWLPFYAWVRFGAYCYLVAPGAEGAPHLYTTYVHPFLAEHEAEIDRFISEAHDNAKRAGLNYLKQAIEFLKVNVLGLPPREPTPPPSRAGAAGAAAGSYAQNLFSRFNLPAAGQGLAVPAGDFYGLMAGALQGAAAWQKSGSSSSSARGDGPEALIPEELSRSSPEERLSYISSKRDQLRMLMQAFDREADHLSTSTSENRTPGEFRDSGEGFLSKSKSELEFDRVEYDEALGEDHSHGQQQHLGKMGQRTASGGWMPWQWGGSGAGGSSAGGHGSGSTSRERSREDRARSSGTDLAY